MTPRHCALVVLLTASMACGCQAARAEECPIPEGADPRLAEVVPAARLAYLREALNHDAHNAHIWSWGWTVGYAVGTAGQLALTPAAAPADRNELYVGAVASALAILPLWVLPLRVASDGPAFEAKVAAPTPDSSPGGVGGEAPLILSPSKDGPREDACKLVQEGEMLVARDAANEAAGTGWLMQVVNVAYNFAIAAVLGWGFHYRWTTALVSGVAGTAIGEGMIFTQPNHLGEAWRSYQSGTFAKGPRLSVGFGPAPGSAVAITGTF